MSNEEQPRKSYKMSFHACSCCRDDGHHHRPFSEIVKETVYAPQEPLTIIEGQSSASLVSSETLANDARTKAMGDAFGDFKL